MKVGVRVTLLLPLAALIGALNFVLGFGSAKPEEVPLEARFYRLSKAVRPTSYEIQLDFAQAFAKHKPTVYSGNVTIDVEFHAPRRTIGLERGACKLLGKCFGLDPNQDNSFVGHANEIVLYADESVAVSRAEVFNESGKPLRIAKLGRDKAKQMIVLKMARDLPRDGRRGQIKFQFQAPIRGDNRGVFYSTDTSSPSNFRHVVAKFQPTFARLALPCFDEPGFKATFKLRIKHDRSVVAHSNMDLREARPQSEVVESVFEETPSMSIHMFAFVLGDFEPEMLVERVRPDLTLSYLSVPGQAHKGRHALKVAADAIEWFEKYFDRKYPLKKFDIVAVSDIDTDNTETWGLVFLRDSVAATDEESQQTSKLTAALNVAHVVAHQWFANLVTAKWWNDFWITESVAAGTAIDFVIAHYPELESEYIIRVGLLSSVLDADSTGQLSALSPAKEADLASSEQIYRLFDKLPFKAGTVGRLLHDMLGPDHMRAALRLVLEEFAYENIELSEYLSCITRAGAGRERVWNVERTLRSFTSEVGFPVVNVAVGGYLNKEDGHLLAYMEPFHSARARVDTEVMYSEEYHDDVQEHHWHMPLRALLTDESGEHRETIPLQFGVFGIALAELPDWFDAEKHALKLQPSPNFGTFYRVRYSDELLHNMRRAIEQKQIGPMDRLHVLNDARSLVRSNLIEPEAFRELFDSYASEESLPVILEMLASAQTLIQLKVNVAASASLGVFARFYREHGFRVSGQESLVEQTVRSALLKALILVEQPVTGQVIEEALQTFARGDVAVFLREPVYVAVVKAGSQAQIDELERRMEETSSYEEKLRLAGALALSKDKENLARLVRFLNLRSGFKAAALKTLIKPQPLLAFENGLVVVRE